MLRLTQGRTTSLENILKGSRVGEALYAKLLSICQKPTALFQAASRFSLVRERWMLLLAEHKGLSVPRERTFSPGRREAAWVHSVLCSSGSRSLGEGLIGLP